VGCAAGLNTYAYCIAVGCAAGLASESDASTDSEAEEIDSHPQSE
jgi:hypothetical protein